MQPAFTPPPMRLATERLLLRPWAPHDAPKLRAAIDRSLPELLPFIPWAAAEPTSLEQVLERIAKFQATFVTGPEWGYVIYDREGRELLGGIGLFARLGPEALEVGYWIRSDAAGQGFGTEATRAMTHVALGMGAARVQLHCNPRNTGSARIAAKLGYRHAHTRAGGGYAPPGSEPQDLMIWVYPADAEPSDSSRQNRSGDVAST